MSARDIIDDAVVFLKSLILGDFVEEQPVSAQLVGGVIALIPVVQQVMNARDVSGVLFRINRKGGFAKATREDYMSLGFAALAVIPEAGSVFKMVFKPLWKERRLAGAALRTGMEMIERMLGMAKGGAVKWIKALEWGSLTEQAIAGVSEALEAMEEMLVFLSEPHWWVPGELAGTAKWALQGVRAMKGNIAEPLTQGVEAIHGFVNDLLGEDGAAMAMAVVAVVASTSTKPHGKAEKTAAAHIEAEHAASTGHPAQKSGAKPAPAPEHIQTGGRPTQSVDVGAADTPTHTSKPTRKSFPNVTDALLGIAGEHIVDYHCLEGKKWGTGWTRHDLGDDGTWSENPLAGLSTTGKLNDHGKLKLLSHLSIDARGQGIDGVWRKKPSGPQKYAVVEAKASGDPLKSLSKLLGSNVHDKDKLGAYQAQQQAAKAAAKRSKRSAGTATQSKRSAGGAAVPSGQAAPAAGSGKPAKEVMPMSHLWVQQRLASLFDLDVRYDMWKPSGDGVNYSRHVMLVSFPHILDHLKAVEAAVVNNTRPVDADHVSHEITREFGDQQLDEVEQQRTQRASKQAVTTP